MRLFCALFLLALPSNMAFACAFDLDCAIGSKCIKARGNIYGICAGGLSPGNSNDRRPTTDPMDVDGTVGNTCTYDTDCGIGGRCAKAGLNILGVCVSRR